MFIGAVSLLVQGSCEPDLQAGGGFLQIPCVMPFFALPNGLILRDFRWTANDAYILLLLYKITMQGH
jgi:hypothetical protein